MSPFEKFFLGLEILWHEKCLLTLKCFPIHEYLPTHVIKSLIPVSSLLPCPQTEYV